jgi:hypothetical protein
VTGRGDHDAGGPGVVERCDPGFGVAVIAGLWGEFEGEFFRGLLADNRLVFEEREAVFR